MSWWNPTKWLSRDPETSAYCLSCKQRITLRSVRLELWANRRVGLKGRCPQCNHEVTRLATIIEKRELADTLNV